MNNKSLKFWLFNVLLCGVLMGCSALAPGDSANPGDLSGAHGLDDVFNSGGAAGGGGGSGGGGGPGTTDGDMGSGEASSGSGTSADAGYGSNPRQNPDDKCLGVGGIRGGDCYYNPDGNAEVFDPGIGE